MDIINTEEKYDKYLLDVKKGTIKRVGKYLGVSKGIDHECQDNICKRKWKPCPSDMLKDDYYCPSCVLHHRNNMKRFNIDRLKWTKDIPNTFYVFSITDPEYPDLKLAKFGRTQNLNSLKRYPNKELKNYNMKLILELRGRLITMTRIENYWKTKGKKLNIFHAFSDKDFHGKSECIKSENHLDHLLDVTKKIYDADNDDPSNTGFEFDSKPEMSSK